MKKNLLLLSLYFISHCADLPQPERPFAPGSGVVLIAGSDFASGFLSAYEPSSGKVYRDITAIHNDSLVRYDQAGSSYVLQRLGSDSLRRTDNAAAYATTWEKSLGTKSNPQSLAFLPGNQIAVSFYNRNTIDILSRTTGAVVQQIDLSAWADADGFAEIGHLWYGSGYLYTAVQRLNRLATDAIWPPADTSYLLKIDTTTLAITAFALSHTNPVSPLHYHAGRNSLLFAAPGRFAANYALDGACLEFSLTSQTFVTPPVTEAQLGYEIADCHLQAGGSGVAIGYDSNLNSVMVAFDATTHALTRTAATLSSANGGYFAAMLLHSSGKIYLADRNIYKPGLRIFSGTLLTEETPTAIYSGLPPLSLEEVP